MTTMLSVFKKAVANTLEPLGVTSREIFRTLPDDFMDVARVDGASEFRIFWSMYLPLCGPALETLGILGWNVFLSALIVFTDPNMSTVQMGLQSFSFNHQTACEPLMAASGVVSLPVLIVFLFAQLLFTQRLFTQSISFTGAK